jgi:ribosomal protein S8
MVLLDPLANALSTIKNAEAIGKILATLEILNLSMMEKPEFIALPLSEE